MDTIMNNGSKTETKGLMPQALQFLKLSELITILGIFVFIPGFIIVNIYLAGLGIHDYSLFRMKYLSAGFLFIGILTVYFFFVWRRIYYAEEDVGNIAVNLIGKTNSKLLGHLWGIFSMALVYADNAFGIVVATSFVSSILFSVNKIGIFWGFLAFYFLIDYPLVRWGKYKKFPRITFTTSFVFYIVSLFVFFYFIKEKEPRTLFWIFVGITIVINFILDFRKKRQQGGNYITKLSLFDWIWVVVFIIMVGISFGKTLYGKITPGLGGGKPIAVTLMIDQNALPSVKEIPIKGSSNLTEKVFLVLQTEKEIYITFPIDNENEKVVQLNKQLVQGIIYLEGD